MLLNSFSIKSEKQVFSQLEQRLQIKEKNKEKSSNKDFNSFLFAQIKQRIISTKTQKKRQKSYFLSFVFNLGFVVPTKR